MSQLGKVQLTIVFTATPELVAEGDRLFVAHAAWMAKTHQKDGNLGVLSYNIVKGPELSNALDPSSAPTGSTTYVLDEVYESQAGLDEHWRLSSEWSELGALVAWAGKCKVTTLHGSPVVQSLW
jgi:quinol monooxygenase YgiN